MIITRVTTIISMLQYCGVLVCICLVLVPETVLAPSATSMWVVIALIASSRADVLLLLLLFVHFFLSLSATTGRRWGHCFQLSLRKIDHPIRHDDAPSAHRLQHPHRAGLPRITLLLVPNILHSGVSQDVA